MWIRNPAEWGAVQIAATGHALSSLGHALIHTDIDRTLAPPQVRRISYADLGEVLVKGFNEFVAIRDDVIFLCLVYPLAGLALAYMMLNASLLPMIFPLFSGFAVTESPPFGFEASSLARSRANQNPSALRPDGGSIVTFIVAAIIGLTLWYLVQPEPLIIQGEADATRIDIAARVDGRVAKRPVERGQNVAAGELLFEIDNPELVTKLHEAEAAKTVALADLAHIEAGTRAEEIAQRKAAVDSAAANLT